MTAHDRPATAAVETALEQIKAHDATLHAIVRTLDAQAAAEARRCDDLAAAGVSLGALHGLPIVVKDIIDVAGAPTESGSLTRKGNPPAAADAPVVAKLRAAGAIPIAKVHTVEFAIGGWGTNETVGTPHNPWDKATPRVPGGSSSGTGVLVGAGLVPAGLGTDTGGSVRIPAAFCGCVGLKTSIGLVSRAGVTPLSGTLDTVGPLTRDVRTAAEMLAVMQGPDPADPTTIGAPLVDPLRDLDKGVRGLRLARLADDMMPLMTGEVRASFEKAVAMLREAGAIIGTVSLPRTLAEYQRRGGAISATEAYATYSDLVDDPNSGMATPNRTRMAVGKAISAADITTILRERDADIAALPALLDNIDAVILPTAPITAIAIADVNEAEMSMSLHTRIANYYALAALALPIDLTPAGLPTSLQIVVRRYDDPLALRIGAAFEALRGPFRGALEG
ncbi:MAG: amidase [Hyphomicrobiaceae bacterium]|nr:amidase [Hyphomicrobiaceae bacterium]